VDGAAFQGLGVVHERWKRKHGIRQGSFHPDGRSRGNE
jgi:hypothetical protein